MPEHRWGCGVTHVEDTIDPWTAVKRVTLFIDVPKGAKVLAAGAQGEEIVAWLLVDPDVGFGETPAYHPDPEIAAEITDDALEAERADLAAGYPPRHWQCECGAEHGRGHFLTIGTHRCLACGYVGEGGVMFGTMRDRRGP